jgi:hypothetical protein
VIVYLGWKAHYFGPDSVNTDDNRTEHKFSYDKARRTGKYYGVQVSGFIVEYNPIEPKQTWGQWFRGIKPRSTPKRMGAFSRFNNVKVAYGVASGGGSHVPVFVWDSLRSPLEGRKRRSLWTHIILLLPLPLWDHGGATRLELYL